MNISIYVKEPLAQTAQSGKVDKDVFSTSLATSMAVHLRFGMIKVCSFCCKMKSLTDFFSAQSCAFLEGQSGF